MRKGGWFVACLGLGMLSLVVAPVGSAAPAKCGKGKVMRVVNGKRTCAAAVAFRQRVTRQSRVTSTARLVIDAPIRLRDEQRRAVADVVLPTFATGRWRSSRSARPACGRRRSGGSRASGGPDRLPMIGGTITPKAFLNSRAGGTALRPMSPGGPIVATGATDVIGVLAPTVSWNLAPSG